MTDRNLREVEFTARCDLLVARDEAAQSKRLESTIFEAYIAAARATSYAAKREEEAFSVWYAASKALDEAPKFGACTP